MPRQAQRPFQTPPPPMASTHQRMSCPNRPSHGDVLKLMDAVLEAVHHELASDPMLFATGIDVDRGEAFGLFRGLAGKFATPVRAGEQRMARDSPGSRGPAVAASINRGGSRRS